MPVRPALARMIALPLLLSAALVAGCGEGERADVQCNLQECAVTFPRGVEVSASVVGIEVNLVEVRDSTVSLEIGGATISVPVGGEAGGIRVREVTSESVVVVIPHGAVG